ncbi:hypothetical protein [Macrococcus brunensis]|nr:hypothetical protein [Macrococcus brunensis]
MFLFPLTKTLDASEFFEARGKEDSRESISPSGISMLYRYTVNGRSIDALIHSGQVVWLTKHDMKQVMNEHAGDENISMERGIAHYNYPQIDSREFGQSVLSNSFNIMGYHAGDDAGDLIEKLGMYESKEDGDQGTVYHYDNFSFMIIDNKIYAITLNVLEENVSPDIQEIWGVQSENTGSEYMRFDKVKDNGFYVEVYPYIGPTAGISGITIYRENYAGPSLEQADTGRFTKEMILNKDFAYSILSNDYNIAGYHAGDNATLQEVIEAVGEPDSRHQNENGVEYIEYGLKRMTFIDDKLEFISLDVTESDIDIDELRTAWGYDYQIINSESGEYTVYDTNKTNGYHVEILSLNDQVQSITIHGDYYKKNHLWWGV